MLVLTVQCWQIYKYQRSFGFTHKRQRLLTALDFFFLFPQCFASREAQTDRPPPPRRKYTKNIIKKELMVHTHVDQWESRTLNQMSMTEFTLNDTNETIV